MPSAHSDPADFPILYIQGTRDLLVVAIAPELEKWISDNPDEPTLAYRQALVAFVLDSLTATALDGLLRERQDQQQRDPPD